MRWPEPPSGRRLSYGGGVGAVEAGLCAMFAATHPDRVSALVLINVAGSCGVTLNDERRAQMLDLIENHWGKGGVHISARVNALARGGEVLVSSTGKDLVVGSDLEFDDRGTHELRGVPGEWRLYAVSN